jgi:thiol-disulfide isomerase/thioredoxin
MNPKLVAALLLAGLLVAGIFLYSGTAPKIAPTAEEPAPVAPETAMIDTNDVAPAAVDQVIDFSLLDLAGNARSISEWNGKGRLINFWATWCAPCRREIPLLKDTQQQHGDNNVQVIGIAVEDLEPVQLFAEQEQFNYPILYGQDEAMAAAESSGVPFVGLPFTMIVAPNGQLLKSHTGEIHESHIETILEIFEQLSAGEIDIAGARSALRTL